MEESTRTRNRHNWKSRWGLRRRSYLGGIIVDPAARATANCVMFNFCDHGARLSSPAPVPAHSIVIIIKHRLALQAARRWQRQDHAGVSFSHSYQLFGDLPAELAYLKNIFMTAHRRRREFMTSHGISADRDAGSGRPIIPHH